MKCPNPAIALFYGILHSLQTRGPLSYASDHWRLVLRSKPVKLRAPLSMPKRMSSLSLSPMAGRSVTVRGKLQPFLLHSIPPNSTSQCSVMSSTSHAHTRGRHGCSLYGQKPIGTVTPKELQAGLPDTLFDSFIRPICNYR